MERKVVHIRMFQFMELEYDGHVVKNMDNHSQKLWQILAYICYFRKKEITKEVLLSEMWDAERSDAGVLKTALHRVRTMLSDTFGEEFGKNFICYINKSYSINEAYTVVCDVEEFDAYIQNAGKAEGEERYRLLKKAFELYSGDFLNLHTNVAWVTPVNVYYYNRYIEIVCDMLKLCEKYGWYKEAVEILQRTKETARYEEKLYLYLMQYQYHMESYQEVMDTYQQLNTMMEKRYDAKPSDKAKEIYYQAMHALNKEPIGLDEIVVLVGQRKAKAMYCEFDFFKELYHAYCSGIARGQRDICLVLITITDLQDQLLPKRSERCCMENLKEILCDNLRAGDIVSICTPCQFILLLPNAALEDAKKAVERVKNRYFKKYAHSPAKLSSYVRSVGAEEHGRYREEDFQ